MNIMRGNKLLYSLLLGCAVASVGGCNHPTETAPASKGGAPAAATSADTSKTGETARYVGLMPSEAELAKMNLNYATFKAGPDGTYFDFVPLPPKSGNVVVGINAPGSYAAKLIDSKCAFDVQVIPSEGAPFVLNTAAPTHPFTLTKPGQLKSVMSDTAVNNYSCNVNLAPL